ncbi:MAG: YfhO family protein [Lachnospiraceae bacterium]|nr:YfhO family protein [Lachnospiraceae bacterium]
MNNIVISKKKVINNLLAFLTPFTIMVLISLKYGFSPFGSKSILMADMRYQFVDYYGYLKQILFGNDDIFYTFSKTFGGDMAGLLAYYCSSPFVLLLAFVPNKYLPAGLLIISMIMLSMASLNFNIMLTEIYGGRWASLIFSIAYAFSGFFMGYFNCTQYFFNIALMPLFILGLYRIFENRRISILYIITLALSIVSNYYIGYMECLFSILFFAYLYFSSYSTFKEIKENIKIFFIYALTSLLAVGISAVGLLCAIFPLQGQSNSRFGHFFAFNLNFNPLDFFTGLYNSAFNGNVSDGLPLIYSGVAATALGILYYFNKRISRREKLLSALVFFFLFLSFWIDSFSVVWHGFSYPIGFPYRNSFLFSFFLIYIAYKCFVNRPGYIRLRYLLALVLGFAIYSAYLVLRHSEYVGKYQIMISFAMLIAVLCVVRYTKRSRSYVVPIIMGLFVLQCGDSMVNASNSIIKYFPEFNETDDYDLAKFQDYLDETGNIISRLDSNEKLFRIEKLYRRSNNDAMLFGYNGLSHFSSCETEIPKEFMGSLGFRNNGNWAYYGYGSTSFADCLMGVKYILSQFDEYAKPYPRSLEYGSKYVYENPYALPLGFIMNKEVKDINLEDSGDLFAYQNDIASSFTGKSFDIYQPVTNVKVTLNNVVKDEDRYIAVDPEKESYLEYSFKARSYKFIFMHFDGDSKQDTKIVINGMEKEPYFTDYGWSIRELGWFFPGDEVNVRVYLLEDEIMISDYDFYYEDTEKLKEWYEEATIDKVDVNKVKSSHLKGSLDLKRDSGYLVFSIPYDENWRIYMDGKKVDKVNVLNGLMAVDATKGRHEFELRYIPKGILVGTPLSLISLLSLILLIIYERKKRKD